MFSNIRLNNMVRHAMKEYAINDFAPKKDPCDLSVIIRGSSMGDMIGMPYEMRGFPVYLDPDKVDLMTDLCTYTDDTAMMAAIKTGVEEIIKNKGYKTIFGEYNNAKCVDIFTNKLREYVRLYPALSYGSDFYEWATETGDPLYEYKSFGNGSAMRAAFLGGLFADTKDVIRFAFLSAYPTHSHPEGIKGAVVAAMCVWLASHGAEKEEILSYAMKHYPNGGRNKEDFLYSDKYMSPDIKISEIQNVDHIVKSVTCQITIPEAIAVFMESESYESCIRNTLRFRGDTDTMGCIAGAIAAAYYREADLKECDDTDKAWKKKLDRRLKDDLSVPGQNQPLHK